MEDKITEAEQIEFVKKHYYNIDDIKNPSEAVHLAAVKADWTAIRNIDKPTIKLELRHLNYHWRDIDEIWR